MKKYTLLYVFAPLREKFTHSLYNPCALCVKKIFFYNSLLRKLLCVFAPLRLCVKILCFASLHSLRENKFRKKLNCNKRKLYRKSEKCQLVMRKLNSNTPKLNYNTRTLLQHSEMTACHRETQL